LVLFGTGIPNTDVRVTVAGIGVEVLYAGPQGEYEGLDQVNVRLPSYLARRGPVECVITAGGRRSNTAIIEMR
jgi:uncharacterized protein (TIGR03437 family)